jgi:ribosomal protein L37AE/L43A
MSSRKKRDKRRLNAAYLRKIVRDKEQAEHVCPECGMKGEYHWVSTSLLSLEDFVFARVPNGFWVCPKFYDPITKRRII